MKRNNTLFILLINFIITPPCFTQRASFQGLGDLPGGTFESSAQSVSDDGLVIAGYGTTATSQKAFRWTPAAGMVSLGNLPDSSFKNSWSNSISANGKVIVGYGDPVGSGWDTYKGFIWTQEHGMTTIGSLDSSSRFMAFSVSADGSVVVGDGGRQAFLWKQAEGIRGLGTLPGRMGSRAVAVSADGSVVIGSSYNITNSEWTSEETFRWTQNGGMQGLGFLNGTNYSFPNAISPDGTVIAGTSVSPSRAFAYRWSRRTGMVSIGYLPGTYTTHPGGVSSDGKIIVGGSYVSMTNGQAFIWDSTNGMRNLKTVLQSTYRLDLTGWTLQSASGITPNGNVIIGWGINPAGNQEAFRVVLDTLLTAVHEKKSRSGPGKFQLNQNYPNPFNPTTVISYQLPVACHVKLSIYYMLGQKIEMLVDSFQNAGEHSMAWNATDDSNNPVSSGIYFFRMETNGLSFQMKMNLIR